MKTQHTPGPWIFDATCIAPIIIATEGREIGLARVQSWAGTPSKEECEANARLIAAAPDMLAALIGLLEQCRKGGCFDQVGFDHPLVKPAFDAAKAAIAKAEGSAQ